MDSLDRLETLEGYQRLFTSVNFWTPYVRAVCQEHGLQPCRRVRTGVPGTCPVFIVEERWVVKFFGRLFDGAAGWAAEREAALLAQRDPRIATARLLACGELGGDGWPWPYLVFEFLQGTSIGEVIEQVSPAGKLNAAHWLGETLRRLHALSLAGSTVFPDRHEPYLRFLEAQRDGAAQRHAAWGSLPPRLVAQVDAYLPPVESLLNRRRAPHLIHADLTCDHLFGRLEAGRWTSLALIDFGDAMTGDLLYELAALHLDLFAGDRALLSACLDAYGLPAAQRVDLPRAALATALLHRFNVFERVSAEARQAASLEALADRLWGSG